MITPAGTGFTEGLWYDEGTTFDNLIAEVRRV